ncbi:MAG: nucleotide exchange factor GrpE [Thermomicrobiales bacterium]|nr:nucleotide exchange factor GrpE [Thermomicrobiales bacterium]
MIEDLERTGGGDPAEDGEFATTGNDAVSELDQLRAESAELLDTLQRSRAEFANYRRRVEQEREMARHRATEEIIRKLLPIADDFERALTSAPEAIAADAWFEGFRLVERKLWNLLSGEGVKPMESLGQPFDPSRHDAVMIEEGVTNADTVVEEFQRGYLVNDTVIRPAMVKVGAQPNAADETPQA